MTDVTVRSMPFALLLAVPLLAAASPSAQPPSGLVVPDPPRPPITADAPPVMVSPIVQPFDLDATRRMAVPVVIDGQGPFSFLVDTGAERTVIASELAVRLGLTEGKRLRLATIGSAADVLSYRVAALRMGGLSLTPFDAPAFAGRHIGAAGLIGIDMLESHRVLIDFRKESMAILDSRKRARPVIDDDDAIVVRARNMAGRLILSDARIEGHRVDVIVDTGAQTSIGNTALQALVEKRKQHRHPFAPTTLSAVSGETVPAVRTAIKRIKLNGADISDLPVSFTDAQAFRALGLRDRPAMLLGMDSLSLFDRVEIDFPNKRVIFDLPSGARRDTPQRFAANAARG